MKHDLKHNRRFEQPRDRRPELGQCVSNWMGGRIGRVPNPNAVKVVTDHAGRALYFSRATIPFDRDGTKPSYKKHLGFYAYRKSALDRFVTLPESSLEKSERLEQLRFLENGIGLTVGETPYDTVGVDTEEDLRRVEKILLER